MSQAERTPDIVRNRVDLTETVDGLQSALGMIVADERRGSAIIGHQPHPDRLGVVVGAADDRAVVAVAGGDGHDFEAAAEVDDRQRVARASLQLATELRNDSAAALRARRSRPT